MSKPEPNTEEQSLRKLVLRAINFNTDATSIAHDIENIIADHQALIETEKREAHRQGGIDELQKLNEVKTTYDWLDTPDGYTDEPSTFVYFHNITDRIKALTTKAEEEKQ